MRTLLNKNEIKMVAFLKHSQLKILASLNKTPELQIHYLGDIFDEETLEKLGIDIFSEFSFEAIIHSLNRGVS